MVQSIEKYKTGGIARYDRLDECRHKKVKQIRGEGHKDEKQ